MASVYVTEYATMGREWAGGGQIPSAQEPAIAQQKVAIGGGSVQSSAFNGATRVVRIHTDAICSIAFGPDPTASSSTKRLAANTT
ncbi:MAG: hypothetical protein RLZZ200_2233, partial [Pseudomonadota bacterium]